MSTDLRIVLPNRPGTLVDACEAIAGAGVGIEGLCGDLRPGETWGYLHVLVEDADKARRALEEAGFEVASEHDVDLVEVEPRVGALVEAFHKYVDEGQNIEVAYLAMNTRVVIGTEAMQRPRPGVKVEDAKY
jgi:hypothetical protein